MQIEKIKETNNNNNDNDKIKNKQAKGIVDGLQKAIRPERTGDKEGMKKRMKRRIKNASFHAIPSPRKMIRTKCHVRRIM